MQGKGEFMNNMLNMLLATVNTGKPWLDELVGAIISVIKMPYVKRTY